LRTFPLSVESQSFIVLVIGHPPKYRISSDVIPEFAEQ